MPSIDTVNKTYSLKEIAEELGGEIEGDLALLISGACGLDDAAAGEITYISSSKYAPKLKKTTASAVIASEGLDLQTELPVIRVADASKAFLKALSLWQAAEGPLDKSGVHASVIQGENVRIGSGVYIGAGTVIGSNVTIADGSSILEGSVIADDVTIGSNTLIYQNVTIRERCVVGNEVILHPGVVIGADGFGYEFVDGEHVKVPQNGNVLIENRVEIGANSAVDRARFGTTIIGEGTKIDNLVQIAHNVTIGKNCLIVSQVGIAGSSKLGDNVILAGQVGVSGHVTIGERTVIGAQSGVFTSVPSDAVLLGSPPLPIREEKERVVYNMRLGKLFKEVKALKKEIDNS